MKPSEATQTIPVIIASFAAFAAAISAVFAGVQMMLARKNAALQSLQSFDKAVRDREAALATATSEEDKQHAFIEFLNFLELYALACNKRLFVGAALDLVRDRLIDSIVVIENSNPSWHTAIESAICHEHTLSELRVFMQINSSLLGERRTPKLPRPQPELSA